MTLILDKRTAFNCGDYADFGKYTEMCNDKTPANKREHGGNTCFTQYEPQDGMWGISPTMAKRFAASSSESQN